MIDIDIFFSDAQKQDPLRKLYRVHPRAGGFYSHIPPHPVLAYHELRGVAGGFEGVAEDEYHAFGGDEVGAAGLLRGYHAMAFGDVGAMLVMLEGDYYVFGFLLLATFSSGRCDKSGVVGLLYISLGAYYDECVLELLGDDAFVGEECDLLTFSEIEAV